jgi:hypothetical protein
LEALGEGLQMFFELQKQRNNVWRFDLLWLDEGSLTSLFILALASLNLPQGAEPLIFSWILY